MRIALVPAVAASALLLAACGSGGSSDHADAGRSDAGAGATVQPSEQPGDGKGGDAKDAKNTDQQAAAKVTVDPVAGATGVDPGKKVTVSASDGTLRSVRISDGDGGAVAGALSADGRTWTSSGTMVPGTTYTVDVAARSAKGKDQTATSTFTTKQATVNKVTMKPSDGGTFGVAQPVSIVFDRPVADKAAVERNLHVTASVPTEGSWGWIKDASGKDRVDWRPKDYWRPGTRVTLDADLKGVKSGTNTYFARDYQTSFTVGSGRVVEVDVPGHKVDVIENGQVVRSLPMSAGSDQYPTRGGTHVILSRNAKETLDSQTVGLGDEYKLPDVPWVVHFTSSGTFFHSAAWNTANIGRNNTSHGCVGMSVADAKWFYDRVQVGDPVVVKGSASTTVTDPGNGFGAWQLSYAQWQAKSALK
ncbi:MAG: L,D-transpeptidase [Streptomycetaceae bacterium]|nr:L,D-transpeptidase [Streptomycetaceae bacterium]